MATSVLQNQVLNFKYDGTNTDAKLTSSNSTFTFEGRSSGLCTLAGIAVPTSDNHAASKTYVDGLVNGVNWKAAVKAASTANVAGTYDSGALTITAGSNGAIGNLDGVTLAASDRILLKNQTTASQNGIYKVTTVGDGSNAYVLTRTADANLAAELVSCAVFVEQGTVNSDAGYVQTANSPITLDSTSLAFTTFSTNKLTGSTGITITGNAISVTAGSIGTTQLTDANVTAGKLAANSVETAKILDSNVTTDKIANLNVTSGKLAADSVITAKILDSNVTTDKVADLNITAGKLAADSVITAKIADDAVTNAKLGSDISITNSQLAGSIAGGKLASDIAISTSGTIVSTHNDGITAKSFTANSDVRLKKNIEQIGEERAWKVVGALNPCNYEFKDDPDKERAGFIAQQVVFANPSLTQSDPSGMMSVNYIDVIPYLVECVKSLKKEVEELKNQS